jgi:hypothetical protein
MDKCPSCGSKVKAIIAKKQARYARKWTEYDAICCTNTKCIWSIELSVLNTIRAEARAEALSEAADRAESWYRSKEYSDELSALSESRISLLRAAITQEETNAKEN